MKSGLGLQMRDEQKEQVDYQTMNLFCVKMALVINSQQKLNKASMGWKWHALTKYHDGKQRGLFCSPVCFHCLWHDSDFSQQVTLSCIILASLHFGDNAPYANPSSDIF